MASDINRDLIERVWILPRLRAINSALETIPEDNLIRFGEKLFGNFKLHQVSSGSQNFAIRLDEETNSDFCFCLTRLYKEEFRGTLPVTWSKEDQELIRQNWPRDKRRGELVLQQKDNQWIGPTDLGRFFRDFRTALLKVTQKIEKSVRHSEISGRNLVFK